MRSLPDIDERRRRFLLYMLSAGAFAALPGCAAQREIHLAMSMPGEMPAGKSIFQYMGDISVNSGAAGLDTRIEPGDTVETGPDSEIIFVVERDAFLLRSNSRMKIPASISSGSYGLEKGRSLGVFASRQTGIRTPSAIISIRGTGVYLEVEPDRSYVCTCYGITDMGPADDPNIRETVEAEHHDAPKYILADSNASNRITPAPFKNHDDQELLLIETLVGRSTPYVVPKGIRRTRSRYI